MSFGGSVTEKFRRVFGSGKPVIAMVHFGALPGAPLHDRERGIDGLIDGVSRDLDALQHAGVDAVMFGNVARLTSVYEFSWKSAAERRRGRGVNFFTLIHEAGRWRVMSIVWDTERPGNELPRT